MNLREYEQHLKKMEKSVKQDFFKQATRDVANRVLSSTIKRTPVGQYSASTGKQGGTLKRGWGVEGVRRSGGQYKIDIVNPVKYALYVEYGHRTRGGKGWVEGRYMLTRGKQETLKHTDEFLRRKLRVFLQGRGEL
jgi:hypothetical protein